MRTSRAASGRDRARGWRRCPFLWALGLVAAGGAVLGVDLPAKPGSPPLDAILQAELERNFTVLSAQDPPLYYLAYTVHDSRVRRLSAGFGAVTDDSDTHERILTVDARVGSHALDNTHQVPDDWTAGFASANRTPLALADDPVSIANTLWRVTDRQVRRAVEQFTKVTASVAARVQDDAAVPDFSEEHPAVFAEPGVPGPEASATDVAAGWADRIRRLSAPFADDPLIFQATVSLIEERDVRDFVSSEGSRLHTGSRRAFLQIQAVTKAPDGMELPLTSTYSAADADGLPPQDALLRDVGRMVGLLGRLRAAPVVDPYSGPAILSGRASAVFFHEIFGHRIEGHRQKDVDEGQTFARQVGKPILPSFLTIVFDPTLATLDGEPLIGHYAYDDEGVKAQRVVAVEHGVLRTFLLGRSPLDRFPHSNGHGRAAPGLRPVSRQSNLIVESARATEDARLVEMLKEECRRQGRAFGLYFENIEGGQTYTGREAANAFNVFPTLVYRIYVDDRPRELVRGVDLIGTPLASFGKIAATGTRTEVFNGFCGAESGAIPVSAASPSILVSEVEVQKKPKSQETSPILPAPDRRRQPAVPQGGGR